MTVRCAPTSARASIGGSPVRRWGRVIAMNTVAAVGVATMFAIMDGRRPFLGELAVSLVISYTIGSLAVLVLPRLTRRLPWERTWLAGSAMLASLLGIAVVGCVLSGFIIVGIGLVPVTHLGPLLRTSLRVSLLITLGLGVGSLFYESTRARLDAALDRLRVEEMERERAEKLAAEARLASLESRLHPHFLFNTLNAISALIPEDPERAERLVEQLAALLRFSLDVGQHRTVPLGTELDIVRAYLGIEQARLGDRLRYAIDLPEELASVAVPPLALHTLVQNSVKHVAAARTESTEMRISGEASAGRLRLRVWDAGPKFALDAVPPGHGLDTLRARLEVLYGGQGRLTIEGAEGGKIVAISLPLRRPG
jgi:sensor histidine kinase YesM